MAPTSRENAALVRRFLTDVVAGGDIDAVDGFLAPDVHDVNLVFDADHRQQTTPTLGWQVLAATDATIQIHDTIATVDQVAIRATVSGTHRESLIDLAPTGNSFEIAYAWFCRLKDGKIVEIHSLPDALGLLEQLDAIPDHHHRPPPERSNL